MQPGSQKSQRSRRSINANSKGAENVTTSSHQGKQSSMSRATHRRDDSKIQKIVNEQFNNKLTVFRDLVK